ncbi:MAG: hypothetical protein CSB19_02180 [Clostridiales bacterium]|nr:MAG: hypothetical protein CSB19_02180 [Clostridiales bacterium]
MIRYKYNVLRRTMAVAMAVLMMILVFSDNAVIYAQPGSEVVIDHEVSMRNLDERLGREPLSDEVSPKVGSTSTVREVGNLLDMTANTLNVKYDVTAIFVDGEPIAYCRNQADAESVLWLLKRSYQVVGADIQSVSFVEDVTIGDSRIEIANFGGFKTTKELVSYIQHGGIEPEFYTVKEGDTIVGIAEANQMTMDDFFIANPGMQTRKYLTVGQQVNVAVPQPLINVQTVENISYSEAVDFEVIEEGTNQMFEGEKEVKVTGKKGQQTVEAQIYCINGVEHDREILSETITEEPIAAVWRVGTKVAPPKKGTGEFDYPADKFIVTSRFGVWRGRRRHTGIDLAMPIGTPVKAADGGVVIFAGNRTSYGRIVIIDHGARMSSFYAHCSELLVKPGDKVFKGQRVALSGNTGRSTGPHLHFEVRMDDVPLNPANYLEFN